MRELDFSDGFTSASEPNQGILTASGLRVFADDAAFVTWAGRAAQEGDVYANSTLNRIRYYDGSQWVTLPDLTNNQTVSGQWTFGDITYVKGGTGDGIDTPDATDLYIGETNATKVYVGRSGITTEVQGDLVVQGNTTTVNTATLDVEDKNITINKGGDDASSEGAGLTVERTGTDGSLIYADAAATKFKIGALGSEVEIADISTAQTLTNKSINADANTITNIDNADIKAAANIERSKIAAGTADHVVINDGSGNLSSEAQLSVSRGGIGIGSYTTGDILYASGASTLAKLAAGTNGFVLKLSGGLPSWANPRLKTITTKNSTDNVATTDEIIESDATGGNIVLTLPTAASASGLQFSFVKTDSSSNTVEIDGNGAETISGQTSITLEDQWQTLTIYSNGTAWRAI